MPGRRGWTLLLGLLAPAGAVAQQVGTARAASVTYVSNGWVFLDAGAADGLRRGDRAEIVQRNRTVAVLRVESLGEHQASCRVVTAHRPPIVGDAVRFSGMPPAGAPPVAARAPARPSPAAAPAAPTGPLVLAAPAAAPDQRPVASAADAAPAPRAAARGTSGDTVPATARVTFLTTGSVYVSAGTGEGLAPGSRVDVIRGGRPVAQLTVVFVSTHQSSCQIISKTDSVSVGDTVRFVAVVAARASAGAPAVPQRLAARRSPRSGRLRGRVSLNYLTVQQRDSLGGQFVQPAGDIRLTGAGLGGSPLGLVLDVRTRSQVRELPGSPTSTASQTRVYQAAATWAAPGSPLRFTTGRQYAPGISSVGLLDGASAEAVHGAWDYGAFAGTQPQLVNLGFSMDIAQLGAYVRRHSSPGSVQRWSMTLGASGSQVNGRANRVFLYLQANYLTRRMSVYAVQEVDYYQPWRRVNGEQAVSPTSTFANLQYQLTPALSLTAGADNRRSVRLYRDVVDPATEFDDTFRRGVWAGLTVRVASHFRAAFDARTSDGGSSASANTYTVALSADRLTPLGASLRSRSTRYTAGVRRGWLNSLSLGLEPFGRGSAQLTSGWRTEQDGTPAPVLNIHWMSLDMDVTLARSIFMIFSGYRERAGSDGHELLYAGLSYRF